MIVADSLTSQGILGLDFLESNQCILDLAKGKLSTCGKNIPLHPHYGKQTAVVHSELSVEETFIVAAMSEMEIMRNICQDCEGTWLVEDFYPKNHRFLWPEHW